MTSDDNGATWTAAGSSSLGPGSGFESSYVKDPTLVWDGSQYVAFYAGFNGSTFAIGRATASVAGGSLTKYGSNPVLSPGGGGSPDENGCAFPFVLYDASLSPAWKIWYMGFPAGSSPGSPTGITVCFADSSDGISWTKRGTVIGAGAGGALDDSGCSMGCAVKVGATYYVHYSGFRSATNFFKSMTATCTDPADSGTYTKVGALSGFSSTLALGGFTWRSNQVRSCIRSGDHYVIGGDCWNASGETEEGAWASTASDPFTVTTPTGLLVPLNDASWHANSAENPAFVGRYST